MKSSSNDGGAIALEGTNDRSVSLSEAIRIAKNWITTELADENPTNIGVEEIEHDAEHGLWNITLGFSRPWNTTRTAMTVVSGEVAIKRVFKVISVSEKKREVVAMRNRDKD